ncbi:undecaprenyl/decaprenyl-phosphate alpha-N-acetylglucosaminyl 1-phosphate transferase [Chloroflexia bacterium SDU3-3]|nr:undecaprenyl/decaprenyl-phosphate alpha-N-acetylglucosaminyl 1-phosphate transferase [Chloroflexia bacterium SDU3-3]
MNGSHALALVAIFFLSLITTAMAIPPVIRLCQRRGWVAAPGGRRLHARPTPTIGGIAMFEGFAVAMLATFALDMAGVIERSSFETERIFLALLGSALLFGVMWVDDVVELAPKPKLAAQIAAALIAVGPFLWDHSRAPDAAGALTEAHGVVLTAFNAPFVGQVSLWNISPWLAIGATVFWIIGMSNTVNLVDGLDGLAAGVSLIAALVLSIKAIVLGQLTVALLPLAIAGACLGFLVFNFPPARIFMGDTGAHLLGFALAVSAIMGGAKLATALLVLGVPILDVAWLIVSRTLGGQGVAHAGRDHLHYRLLDLGYTPRQIVLFYYTLSASFGMLGIAVTPLVVKLIALLFLAAIVGFVLLYISRRTNLAAKEAAGAQQPKKP